MDFSHADALARERRARLAAERMLEQKQKELFAANEQLSRHALSLSDQIVEKREEVETVRHENSRVREDLEQVRQAMDIAKKRLWHSVETIQDGFAVFDADSSMVVANPAYLAAFDGMECVAPGIRYEEIIDILVEEGIVDIGDDTPDAWRASMLERWNAPRIEPRTIRLWNGQFIKLLDRRASNGDTVSLALDITDTIEREKQLEEALVRAEAANRAKSAFLAKMSHELRTPMNGVVGMADMLADTTLDEDQTLFVETIRNSGEMLLGLINDVLDFSKMEAKKLVLHPEPFDLEKTLNDILVLFQPAVMAKEGQLELILDYDLFLPTGFIGDAGRIRQILTNLIGNAIKFTSQGHVIVRIVGLPEGDGNGFRVHFSVEDTGLGIPADKIEHVFGEFNQVEDEKNRQFEGTGLGLAITRQLVSLMGGEIWVDSVPGEGSNFGFYLPLAQDDGPAFCLDQLPDWLSRVILVSAPSPWAELVSRQMRTLGADVQEFPPEAFLAHPVARTGDVVVVHAQRNAATGSGVMDALARAGIDVPVIVVQELQDSERDLAQRGAQLLSKPAGRRQIMDALQKLPAPARESPCAPPPETAASPAEPAPVPGPAPASDPAPASGPIASPDPAPTPVPDPAPQIESVPPDEPPQGSSGGAGAVLAFEQPPAKSADEAPHPPAGRPPEAARKMFILAAEDNKTNRLVLSKLVRKLNIELAFAENGVEAVEKWRAHQPDLVFMDISMPLMDGKEATRRIREAEAQTGARRTPIIALTAHAMSGDDEEILSSGLDHYLTKPLKKNDIFEQIAAATPPWAEPVFEEEDAPGTADRPAAG